MNLISSIYDLMHHRLHNSNQRYFYVILLNPYDLTPAGEKLLNNLNLFDIDSGKRCDYFLPGFANDAHGLYTKSTSFLGNFGFKRVLNTKRLGTVYFNEENFCEFYNYLEDNNPHRWFYSGGCEFLLLDILPNGSVDLENIISYNLDDIIRNKRSLSEFIRGTIQITRLEEDKQEVKNQIDNLFYNLIMPSPKDLVDNDYYNNCVKNFDDKYRNEKYCFISYSTKDFYFVNQIRKHLQMNNIKCWMAPFDIPNGTNYAYIIELALQKADKFILMLSENSLNSVWVGKELKRAINIFQLNSAEKLCITWLDRPFPLRGTPFALPLEDVQIDCMLKNDITNVDELIKVLK